MAKLPKEMENQLAIKDPPEQVQAVTIGFQVPQIPIELRISFDPTNINSIKLAAPQFVMLNLPYLNFLLSLAAQAGHKMNFDQAKAVEGIMPASEGDLKIADQAAQVAKKNRKILGLDD